MEAPTNFEWKRPPEKNAIFFVKTFQKKPKNDFLHAFFRQFAGGAEKMAKIRRGSRNFSNGADFQKKIESFVDLFFMSTK